MENLFNDIPADMPGELFETLCSTDIVKIERIVSRGHASAQGCWYDQDRHEFVLVLQGSAGVRFAGRDDIQILKPGDYLDIKAHVRHRVEWTDSGCETIWLAVHYK